MSFILNLSDSSSTAHNFTTIFKSPIILKSQYEVSLISFNCYNTYHNISSALNNNTIQYKLPLGSYTTITFPDGRYSVNDLNLYVKSILTATNKDDFFLKINNAINRTYIITANGINIKFNSDLYLALGFAQNQEIVINATTNGINTGQMERLITHLNINLDCINSNFSNSSSSHTIYSFIMDVMPGILKHIDINEKVFSKVNTNCLNSVRMWITDNLNRNVDFKGEPVSASLYFRKIE